MKKFVAGRLLSVLPVLAVVSVVIFSIVHLAPGDPAASILGDNATAEDIAALRTRMGLDKPLAEQYLIWMGNILHGDFGLSVAGNETVAHMLASHWEPTLSLTVFSTVLALCLAIPLGILAARKKGTAADYGVSVCSLAGISLPSFLLGLFLMMLFAVKLRILPVSGYVPVSEGLAAHFRSLLLPGTALGFMHSALLMRMTKSSMLEVLGSDYIKMAKAKGVKELFLVVRHAFRNALIPVLTTVGQSIVGALAGAAVVESMFAIPGMGQLMVNSIGRRDYYVIQAIVLVVACINVLVNLAVDLLYGLADPRVRLQ